MSAPDTRPPAGFGESGGLLSYGSYLRLPSLLTQQVPESDPPAHDELLFITIHQVYELWFAQLLHELTAARDGMLTGRTYRPRQLLARAHVIERLLVEQVDVLETMTPQDFLAFRAALSPASGFQSVQFRELEFLSGAKDPSYVDRLHDATDDERARARAHGRAADRHQDRYRRLQRRRVPAQPTRAALFPGAVGPPPRAVGARSRQKIRMSRMMMTIRVPMPMPMFMVSPGVGEVGT